VRMSGLAGVEATRQQRDAGPRVILLTTYDDLVLAGMCAGAAGYLLKDQPAEEIIEAIHAVQRGEALFRTSGAARVLAQLAEGSPTPDPPLAGVPGHLRSDRENPRQQHF